MPSNPKFIYFGTPLVSRRTLEILLEHSFVPSLVVTSPDAPKGRGLTLTPSPTKILAAEKHLPLFTPEKLNAEALARIAAEHADYAIVVAYGKIFPETLITSFPKGVINIHYSLLPKYRGASPMEAALLSGDVETGVTVQKMVREVDAGDIIAQEKTVIAPNETARELRPRLIEMGATLLVASLPGYLDGSTPLTIQDASQASHAPKFQKEDGLLSLDAPGNENWNTYRAYTDTIGTYFMKDGKRHKITKASYKNGTFIVERVIPEGKKEIEYGPR